MIVVDASVAVQWVVEESTTPLSETLLSRSDLIAPDLLLIEAANALYRKVFVGDVSPEQAKAGLHYIQDKVRMVRTSIDMLDRAIRLANEMNHPVYDCLYLVVAEDSQSQLVTYDQELLDRARHYGRGHLVTELPLQP